ncbi:MAG: hypothetical protein H7287_06335 [Thermoleophilia bacterium]|nr:hypothetical protein [Thermoleophilia bacterium]
MITLPTAASFAQAPLESITSGAKAQLIDPELQSPDEIHNYNCTKNGVRT